MNTFKVVVPSRYGSSRLPGKPLLQIAGKSMIQRVYENAVTAGAAEVVAATDDERIVAEIERFGGNAMLTSTAHRSGTDRIAEVATRQNWSPDTVVVNLQGDEPGIGATLIQQVALALHEHPEAGIATMATPIGSAADLFNPNVVKVICNNKNMALYFSRAPIPWNRDLFDSNLLVNQEIGTAHQYLRHLGLYAYRVGALQQISTTPPSSIELLESLEQLRAMSMGIGIHVTTIAEAPGHGVDTMDDLKRVENSLSKFQ
ncbi:MAG: 3-deoxy-manno-octulosonate cytidylyltransferase [Deltaproteobacteria bacterium]|nr:3-deoxy-manno-octulosonate cytidylyltransferase [Deltaproteobacteria bacterium]